MQSLWGTEGDSLPVCLKHIYQSASYLILLTLFLIGGVPSALAHGHEDWDSEELLLLFSAFQQGLAMVNNPSATPSDGDLCVRTESVAACIPKDAFSHALALALPMVERQARKECPDCTQAELEHIRLNFKERWDVVVEKLKDGSLELSGWALEKLRSDGPSWVIYTWLFEVAEHSVAPFLPPGNPVCWAGQALYFCTVGAAKNTLSMVGDSSVGGSVGQRLSRPLKGRKLSNMMGARLRTLVAPVIETDEFSAVEEVGLRDYERLLNLPLSPVTTREYVWHFLTETPAYMWRWMRETASNLRWFFTGFEKKSTEQEAHNALLELEEYLAQSRMWRSGYYHFRSGDKGPIKNPKIQLEAGESSLWRKGYYHFGGNENEEGQTQTVKLQDDLDFIFGSAPLEARHWRAFQHGNGWSEVRDLLSRIISSTRSERSAQRALVTDSYEHRVHEVRLARAYRTEKSFTGTLDLLVKRYRNNLLTAVLAPLDAKTRDLAFKSASWLNGELLRLVGQIQFQNGYIVDCDKLLRRAEELLHVQRAFWYGNHVGSKNRCAAEVTEAQSSASALPPPGA